MAVAGKPTFEEVAREWHGKQLWATKHTADVLRSLEFDIFPHIGGKPIDAISPQDIISILRGVESREALDVARRVNQRCAAVFDYGIVNGLCDYNPASGRAKSIKATRVQHRPHLKLPYIPAFLRALDTYHGSKKVQLAMKLLFLTFLRPGELRHGVWSEIDFDRAEWSIPASRMKMRRPHIVPLSKQAIVLLKELHEITGKGQLLFPGSRHSAKPFSDVTLLKVLIILGYNKGDKKFVPHGIRGTASTNLNEAGEFRPDAIERQLAHNDNDRIRAAYNHTEYMPERRIMMQWWADFLDQQRSKGVTNAKG